MEDNGGMCFKFADWDTYGQVWAGWVPTLAKLGVNYLKDAGYSVNLSELIRF